MHRIDQMVAEVLLTLKRHHVEEEGLAASLAQEAEAEVKKLRADGMDERKAIRRVQGSFPAQALGRRGIKIVDEARWLRIYVIATLLALGIMDLVWLGRGQQFLFMAAIVSILAGIIQSALEQWISDAFLTPWILENGIIVRRRKIFWDEIEGIYYSQWFGIRLALKGRRKLSFRSVSRRNVRFFRRLVGELEKKGLTVPELVKALTAAREFQIAPERRGFYKALFSICQLLILGMTCSIFVVCLKLDLNPAFFVMIILLAQSLNILIFVRLINKLEIYHFRLMWITFVWFCSAAFLILFRDQVYVAVLFSGTALMIIAISLRAWFLPYPRKGFHAAALAFSLAALASAAACFMVGEKNIETVVRIKNETMLRKITLGRGRLFLAAEDMGMPSGEYGPFKIYNIDLIDRSERSSEVGSDDKGYRDVSSSPGGGYFITQVNKLDRSSKPCPSVSHVFYVTDTDSMQTKKIAELDNSYPFMDGIINEPWSPDGSRFIILSDPPKDQKSGPFIYNIYDARVGGMVPFSSLSQPINFQFWKDRDHIVFRKSMDCKTSRAGAKICTGRKYLMQNVNDGSTAELYQWKGDTKFRYLDIGQGIEGVVLKGDTLLTIDHRKGEIYQIGLKSKDASCILSSRSIAWRKSNDEIILARSNDKPSRDMLTGFAAVNYKTGECTTFTLPKQLPMLYFHLSPDGKKIALLTSAFGAREPPLWKLFFQFFYGSELWIYDLETGSLRKLMDRNYQLFYNDDVVWSEDSKYIYTGMAQFRSIFDWESRLRIVRIKVDE